MRGRSGRKVALRFAATGSGTATVDVLRGRTRVARLTRRLKKGGRASVTWNGKVRSKGRLVAAKTGRYTVKLVVKGNDGQTASDALRLTLTR